MPRFKAKLAYHGKLYHGFQVQPKRVTVQKELESALKRILDEKLRVVPSGRTDTGVHALEQVVHFDVKTDKALGRIAKHDMVYKLNSVLPEQVLVTEFKKAHDQFHARNHAKKKSYVYIIVNSSHKNPFFENIVWRIPKTLDEKAMKKAAAYLMGTHDFSAFCASDSTAENKVRTITEINFTNKKIAPFLSFKHERFILIEFIGTGFLKQMVRAIVGTLVAVGQNKIKPEAIKTILKSKDRKEAWRTAPAQGLFLKKVWY